MSHVAVNSEPVALSWDTVANSTLNSGSWGFMTSQTMKLIKVMTTVTAKNPIRSRPTKVGLVCPVGWGL